LQLVADQLESCSIALDLQLQKTPVSTMAVGSSHNTRPWCSRTQLTTTFVGDQLTVVGQIGWSHAGQWQWSVCWIADDINLVVPQCSVEGVS